MHSRALAWSIDGADSRPQCRQTAWWSDDPDFIDGSLIDCWSMKWRTRAAQTGKSDVARSAAPYRPITLTAPHCAGLPSDQNNPTCFVPVSGIKTAGGRNS
jgi:hypothetical protein